MKNINEYDRLSFKKRISKINNNNFKRRPNSSFIYPSSTNYTMNSLYLKNNDISKYTQLNNSCLYQKNNKIISNLKKNRKNPKGILYDDSIKLKTKINKLKKEIEIMKSDNRKKDEEIKKRKKDLLNAQNNDVINYDDLKEENYITKLKNNYENIKYRIKIINEENNKIQNNLKTININNYEQDNLNNLFILKDKIQEYYINLKKNLEFNNKIHLSNFNREEFFNNHHYIQKIQYEIQTKKKKINVMKQNLLALKEKCEKIEEERKKLMYYNNSLRKRNEKLLLDKKNREDFILQKPVLLGKINEYELKIKNIEDINKKNEDEIIKISNARKKILEQIRALGVSKPINYDEIISIQNNPYENINQKIILLRALIKESKDRQNDFIEVFEYYEDYVQQKEKYDIINNEAKILEEKNFLNINNNNDIDNNNINNNDISDEYKQNLINEENKNIIKEKDDKEEKNDNDNIIDNNDIINIDNNNINDINDINEENINKKNINDNNKENELISPNLQNSPSSINSKKEEKKDDSNNDINEIKNNINNININEDINNNKFIIKSEGNVIEKKKEKKYKNFKFLLSIIFMNQGLKKVKK